MRRGEGGGREGAGRGVREGGGRGSEERGGRGERGKGEGKKHDLLVLPCSICCSLLALRLRCGMSPMTHR